MTTIEQAAREYADSLILGDAHNVSKQQFEEYAQCDFKAGVEFAQRWRDPKTEKPETEELVQVKIVIVTEKGKNTAHEHDQFNIKHQMFEIEQQCGVEVIGWRPIDIK